MPRCGNVAFARPFKRGDGDDAWRVGADGRARSALRTSLVEGSARHMTGARLARVEELFHAALELPAAERAGFLAVEPDAGLRAEVLRLLARHAESDAILAGALDSAL